MQTFRLVGGPWYTNIGCDTSFKPTYNDPYEDWVGRKSPDFLDIHIFRSNCSTFRQSIVCIYSWVLDTPVTGLVVNVLLRHCNSGVTILTGLLHMLWPSLYTTAWWTSCACACQGFAWDKVQVHAERFWITGRDLLIISSPQGCFISLDFLPAQGLCALGGAERGSARSHKEWSEIPAHKIKIPEKEYHL